MSEKTLTKKRIRETGTLELLLRTDYLYATCDRRPRDAGVPVADIREASAIDGELRLRLCKILAPY